MEANTNNDNAIGKVFRHKRLFNYVATPLSMEDGVVTCIAGNGIEQQIPMDYFKRDWSMDETINLEELMKAMEDYPDETPFTQAYNDHFEPDDGKEHCYLHFDDYDETTQDEFPQWRITKCTKKDRDKKINPFTMIMPIKDDCYDTVGKELIIINEIRQDNAFISYEDFTGFEFGLIKLLEKKYLREI